MNADDFASVPALAKRIVGRARCPSAPRRAAALIVAGVELAPFNRSSAACARSCVGASSRARCAHRNKSVRYSVGGYDTESLNGPNTFWLDSAHLRSETRSALRLAFWHDIKSQAA